MIAGGAGTGKWNVRSRWSVFASRTLALSPLHLEPIVSDAVTEALDMEVDHLQPQRWEATLRRPLSMFDQCDVRVSIGGAPEDSASTVEIEITFDASEARLAVAMNVVTSIVGAPFVVGWRYQSVRSAKAHAQRIIGGVWLALERRTNAVTAYR